MAAWEWRVFLEITAEVDIWELLRTKPWGVFCQERTDVYLVRSARAGVKLRGKKTLEVKLRSCRHESGAELWEKVHTHVVRLSILPQHGSTHVAARRIGGSTKLDQ